MDLSSFKSSVKMLRLVVLATAVTCVLGAPRLLQRPRYPVVGEDRIVGGSQVDIEERPFQISLEEFGIFVCGASIISSEWAVSAAHCLEGSQPRNIHIRSGSADRHEGDVHNGNHIVVNELYDSFTIDYDVAVIRVNQPFVFSATTAAIALATTAPATGTPAFVSGWGTTSAGSIFLAGLLRGVEVPIYDQAACNTAYEEYGGVTDRMICAGVEKGGIDACQGDSGGPLTVNGELVGIVSWGLGCAMAGYPGVYSNVAVLNQWIVDNAQ